MTNPARRRLRNEQGSVLISGLLLSFALLLVIGAATDIGHAFIVHRELVATADDAALTGSQALDLDALHQGTLALDPAAAQQAALATATTEPGLQVQANADLATVHVRVEQRVPTILLRLVGVTTLTLTADATASPHAP
jgi:Flp pilus assembly protein TadG